MFSLEPRCNALIGKLLLELCNIMSDVEIITSHARKITNIWLIWLMWYGLIIDLWMLVVFENSLWSITWDYSSLLVKKYSAEGQAYSRIIANRVSSTADHLIPAASVNTADPASTSSDIFLPTEDVTYFQLAEDKRAKGSSYKPCDHTLANTVGLTDNL